MTTALSLVGTILKKTLNNTLETPPILNQSALSQLKTIDNYLYVKQILDSKKTRLISQERTLIQAVANKFPDFRSTYDAYARSPLLDSDEIKNTTKLLLVAAFFENQNLDKLKVYVEEAKKLLLLLQKYSNVIEYFKNHVQVYALQPVRNLCAFKLPTEFVDRFDFWLNFVLNYGPNATKYLSSWPSINYFLCELKSDQQDASKFSDWPFANGRIHSLINLQYFFLVVHVLKNLKTFKEMHSLLIGKGVSRDAPLDSLINPDDPLYSLGLHRSSEDLPAFITSIVQLYEGHPKELPELIGLHNFGLFELTIAFKNSVLFKTVLENTLRICGQNLTISALTQNGNTILNVLIKTLKDQKMDVIKPFIDALFSICELKHKQQFILLLDYDTVPCEVLDYLLESINAKDDKNFLAKIERLEEQRLLNILVTSARNNDFNYYQKLFKYEGQAFYILNHPEQFLSKNWKAICAIPKIHTNPFLVRTLFSLIKNNKQQFDELVNKVISDIYVNTSYPISSLIYKTPFLKWRDLPNKNILQDHIDAIFWIMIMEVMEYISERNAKNQSMTFMAPAQSFFDIMISALRNDDARFISLLTLENPLDLALFSSHLKQTTTRVEGVIQCIKLLLIKCSQKESMELIKTYQKKLPEFFNKEIIEELTSYVASIKKAALLSTLDADLYRQKNTWNLQRDSMDAAALSELLSRFALLSRKDRSFSYIGAGGKWHLVTESEINEAWVTAFEYFNAQKQGQVSDSTNNPKFDSMSHQYKLLKMELMGLGVKEEEQEKIARMWDEFATTVNSNLNVYCPPETTEFRSLCSEYHKKMIALNLEEKERTIGYKHLLQSDGLFAYKEVSIDNNQKRETLSKKRDATELN